MVVGVEMFGPPMAILLAADQGSRKLSASTLSNAYKHVIGIPDRLKDPNALFPAISTWSLERSGCPSWFETPGIEPARIGPCGSYYETVQNHAVYSEADVLLVMDVLFKEIGILGLFSDFPATVTTYANCVLTS